MDTSDDTTITSDENRSTSEDNTVTSEDIAEAFDDLGYSIDDPEIITKLRTFCDLYKLDKTKLSCAYLKFANKKSYKDPNFNILEEFEEEVLKKPIDETSRDIVAAAKKPCAKQKSIKDFFSSTSAGKSKEDMKGENGSVVVKKILFCRHCGAQKMHKGALETHEFNCLQNPFYRQYDQHKKNKKSDNNLAKSDNIQFKSTTQTPSKPSLENDPNETGYLFDKNHYRNM